MVLGGVLLAGIGIIVSVLVANGRWDNVWNAAIPPSGGGSAAPPNSTPGAPGP